MKIGIFALMGALALTGCYSVSKVQPPKLNAYSDSVKNDSTATARDAAVKDFDAAAEFCWSRSNNYEIRSKNSEFWRLGIGAGGGVLGFAGAMMVAAGTGGVAPGIASGLAGVSSVLLSDAKDGPLAPKGFILERNGIASIIKSYTVQLKSEANASDVHDLAVRLKHDCRAASTAIDDDKTVGKTDQPQSAPAKPAENAG